MGGAQAQDPVTFAEPVVAIPFPAGAADTTFAQSEPRLLWLQDGRLLLGAQFEKWNCVTKQPRLEAAIDGSNNRNCLWASSDGGATWEIIGGDCCTYSNDVDLAQTPDGIIFESVMSNVGIGTGSGGTTVTRSVDNGKTWIRQVTVNYQVANDRPFILAESDANVLLSYTAPPGNIFINRSADGGATWGLPEAVTPTPPQLGLSLNGEPIVNKARGQIVLSYGYVAGSGGGVKANELAVARSSDHGANWTTEPVAHLGSAGALGILSLAADEAGHEYQTYYAQVGTQGVGVFLIRSDADGQWSSPMRVDPPTGSAMLGEVRAVGDGQLAVAYYGSTFADGRNTVRPWTVDVAISRDGGRSFSYAPVSRNVVYLGTQASQQLKIFDLTALAIDANGYIGVAYTNAGENNPRTTIDFAWQVGGQPLNVLGNVFLDGRDTGVADRVDKDGVRLSKRLQDAWSSCAAIALAHGAFVTCFGQRLNAFTDTGLITEAEKDIFQSIAAESSVGKG